MNTPEKYQLELLEQADGIYRATPLTPLTRKAFLTTPRHRFVSRYRNFGTREWKDVSEDNLHEHLATLYADTPLVLLGDDDSPVSTISQPSFVLRMLDMLQLKPGQTVFELGAGSGWNAALASRLVGPRGHVYSVEIVIEIAEVAAASISAMGIENVSIIQTDGGFGYPPGAPYDRAIFTAGAYDLPRHFYDQIKDDGLLLVVIKNLGGGDNLFLLQKHTDHFESLDSMSCSFVQFTGNYQINSLDPIAIETLPRWHELKMRETSQTPFWWGGKGKDDFARRTAGVLSFLGIAQPHLRTFKHGRSEERAREEHYFGLYEPEIDSLVIAEHDVLRAYGNDSARDQLIASIHQWVDLGMPAAASFNLRVHPIVQDVKTGANEWLVKRRESQFVWSI